MWRYSGSMLPAGAHQGGRRDFLAGGCERFIELGASRLGTSRIVKLIQQEEAHGD